MMKQKMKMTAREIAHRVMCENRPFDYRWLRHIRKTYTQKELHQWGVSNVEFYAPEDASKQLIGRAASILIDEVFAEVW